MSRVYNFSAGPAMLPEEVLQQIKEELLDWHGIGSSVMEISHRSKEFKQIAEESKQDLRELLTIPDNYHVLFLHGGSRTQFAMVPMNLLNGMKKTAYVQTGIWGKLAVEEARRYSDVTLVADSESSKFSHIPDPAAWQVPQDAAYLHYVDNETVNGVEFSTIPDAQGLPLVADMSSNILSRPFDVEKFALFYACAQKNMGPAGVTVAVIRDDMLNREVLPFTPSMLRYELHAQADSLYNTSPTFPWYVSGLMLKWLKRQGGVTAMAKLNKRKSQKLYDVIDQSDFYSNPVDKLSRSKMNVIFTLANDKLDDVFLSEAEKAGLTGLKGHRVLGGMRASIYNAMPEKGVDTLIEFMGDFEKRHA